MTNLALITGASSGIGKEFARYHATQKGDLIITARREAALKDLKTELESAHGVTVHTVALDLAAPGGARALIGAVAKLDLSVDILINNAGFGGHGAHTARDWDDEAKMIDLNVRALVELSQHFGKSMAELGGGKILNVASVAAMMPGPLQAVYFATKAFVLSYSQALDEELRAQNVTVTTLNPGYVVTEFADVANLGNTGLVSQGGKTPDTVAAIGYKAMQRGKLVVFNEARMNFLMNWLIPLMPRRAVLKMVHGMQTKKG